MNRFARRIAAPLVVFALVGAACGGGETTTGTRGGERAQETTHGTDAGVGLDTGAAALTQTLTDLLDGHVYLASITVVQGLTNGLDSPEFEAAAGTLDENSQDLAAAIESVYGPEAGEQFLKQWRDHISFFVDYTKGVATDDEALADEARTKLENYRQDFAAFLDSATGGKLPADAAADALQMHVNSLIDAIDAAAAGDPTVFAKVYAAATEHMPATASALAGAITAQFPDKFEV